MTSYRRPVDEAAAVDAAEQILRNDRERATAVKRLSSALRRARAEGYIVGWAAHDELVALWRHARTPRPLGQPLVIVRVCDDARRLYLNAGMRDLSATDLARHGYTAALMLDYLTAAIERVVALETRDLAEGSVAMLLHDGRLTVRRRVIRLRPQTAQLTQFRLFRARIRRHQPRAGDAASALRVGALSLALWVWILVATTCLRLYVGLSRRRVRQNKTHLSRSRHITRPRETA